MILKPFHKIKVFTTFTRLAIKMLTFLIVFFIIHGHTELLVGCFSICLILHVFESSNAMQYGVNFMYLNLNFMYVI